MGTLKNKTTIREAILESKNLKLYSLLVLIIFTFIVFSVALRNNILTGWDDGEYLTNPDIIGNLIGSGRAIFSSFYLGMYQPLAILSFRFNYQISDSAASFIFINILLHLVNVYLTYRLSLRLFNRFLLAMIVAFLFAIHPMHVEGVVWISTRSSLLYSLFFLSGLLAYVKYIKTSAPKYYVFTLGLALLSLFSKSMAVTFPLVLLAFDYFYQRKLNTKLITEKIPFFILSIIFGIVAINASASFGHITALENSYGFFERIILILYGISFYVLKSVLPFNLSVIYAFPESNGGIFPLYVYSTLLILLLVVALIHYSVKNRRVLIFGLLFFLTSVSIVLPLFWSRIFIVADRYTYIPYLGLFFIVARLLTDLHDRRDRLTLSTSNMVTATLIVAGILLSSATYRRIKIWYDVPMLLNDVIDKQRSDADLSHAYFYLGNYYDSKGLDNEAVKNYSLSISRNSKYIMAYNNRGILKGKNMNPASAISDFNNAIFLKPDYSEAYYNRGIAYYQTGKHNEACNDWIKAHELGFKPAKDAIEQYCSKQKTGN